MGYLSIRYLTMAPLLALLLKRFGIVLFRHSADVASSRTTRENENIFIHINQ